MYLNNNLKVNNVKNLDKITFEQTFHDKKVLNYFMNYKTKIVPFPSNKILIKDTITQSLHSINSRVSNEKSYM